MSLAWKALNKARNKALSSYAADALLVEAEKGGIKRRGFLHRTSRRHSGDLKCGPCKSS